MGKANIIEIRENLEKYSELGKACVKAQEEKNARLLEEKLEIEHSGIYPNATDNERIGILINNYHRDPMIFDDHYDLEKEFAAVLPAIDEFVSMPNIEVVDTPTFFYKKKNYFVITMFSTKEKFYKFCDINYDVPIAIYTVFFYASPERESGYMIRLASLGEEIKILNYD